MNTTKKFKSGEKVATILRSTNKQQTIDWIMAPPSSSSRSKPRRRQQATAPLIKGYLPVRLCLPTTEEGRSDDTFFYVKEHRDHNNTTSSTSTSTTNSTTTTLFVANAPVIPPVSTKLLLKSIFGRYGDVTRVTVVPNPRHFKHQPSSAAIMSTSSSTSVDEGIRWTDQFAAPSYFHHAAVLEEQGRFAHVVFSSTKELKACLSSLHQVMAAQTKGDKNARTSKADDSNSSSDDDDDYDDDDEESHDNDSNNEKDNKPQAPGLVLDLIELQTLADETDRLYREEHRHRRDDSDDDDDNKRKQQKTNRVLRVAERYRETCCTTSRDRKDLLEECNRVMQQYDDEQARALAATTGGDGEPLVDGDGFVTVTYGNSAGAAGSTGKRALDEAPVHEQGQKRRKGQKRSRGSKKGPGASELVDFYRFQTKENRKKTLHELREQFEQDLAKVQKLKQERQYRPF